MNNEKTTTQGIQELLDRGIHRLTLPDHNQKAISAFDYVRTIQELVTESPSIALSFAMHLYTAWGLQVLLSDQQKDYYYGKVREEQALFASLNEPGLYFVNPKQINPDEYPIVAEKRGDSYVVNGAKHYVSLEPFVQFLPVYVLLRDYQGAGYGIAVFMLEKDAPGVTVEQDWDSVAMQDTHSNKIVLKDVVVRPEQVICPAGALEKTELLGYLFRLSVSSVYQGIAKSAIDHVVEQVKKKKVPHTQHKLAAFPGVQFSLAEMVIQFEVAQSQLRYFCDRLDAYGEGKLDRLEAAELNATSLVTKEFVTRTAETIVGHAMKIEGISSLFQRNKLSTLYRDVKAGSFHPPQSDVVHELLGKQKLGIISFRNRWL